MQTDSFVFLIHIFSALMMTGIVWLIQLVHYPSFFYVDKAKFVEFESFHTQNISLIVMPLMIVELLSALYLASRAYFELIYTVNIVLIIGIWLSTFLLSVPVHNQLSKKWSAKAAKNLVNTNWIRTFLWTIKALLLAFLWYERGLF